MSISISRGGSDRVLEAMIAALQVSENDHPHARIERHRQNSVSVRVRILDPDFAGKNRIERHEEVWQSLDVLSDEDQSDLSTLILLTPEEKPLSFANFEFEDPVPSGL